MLTLTMMAALQIFDESQIEANNKLSKQIKTLEKRIEELSKSKKSGTKKEIE